MGENKTDLKGGFDVVISKSKSVIDIWELFNSKSMAVGLVVRKVALVCSFL
jgi:hypothetical protein